VEGYLLKAGESQPNASVFAELAADAAIAVAASDVGKIDGMSASDYANKWIADTMGMRP
jgi:hypothetical protein